MTFTAQQINQLLGGELVGDASRAVCTIAGIETAAEGALCFLSDAKYVDYLATTKASVVIVTRSLLPASGYATGAALVLVDNARAAMGQLLRVVEQTMRPARRGIEQPSFIAEGVTVPEDAYVGAMAYIGHNVKLGEGVQIYPQVYIGDNVTIGAHTVLYPGVKVYYNCVIGADCVLHGGVIVGGDGFGFEPDAQGVYQKVPQIGTVVIEDDVEIGANTTIDRAMMGETRIGKNTKIDNLCQVAHNVQIGQSTILCAQVGIAGSTSVGSHCMLTGQVGVAGHIAITDGCIFGAQSGVSGNVTKPGQYMGSPAIDAARWRRAQAVYRNLPEIYKKIK